MERVSSADSFGTEKKGFWNHKLSDLYNLPTSCFLVCNLLNSGVAGIIGPTSEITVMHTRSICDSLEIPHLEVHRDVTVRNEALSINLHPRPEVLTSACLDICRGLGWEDFAIVYDNNENIVLYTDFFREAKQKGWKIMLYQISSEYSFRDTFTKIKKDRKDKIILDVRHERVIDALKTVSSISVINDPQITGLQSDSGATSGSRD